MDIERFFSGVTRTVLTIILSMFFGVALGVIGLVAASLYYETNVLRDWQTLVAGGLALVAAFGTIWATILTAQRQIKAADLRHQDERYRRNRAARAVLPLALSAICYYTKAWMRLWADNRENIKDGAPIDRPPPEFPDSVITPIKECIEFAEEEPAATLAELLRKLQVHNARNTRYLVEYAAQGATNQERGARCVDDAILFAAKVYAHAERHFDYAETEDVGAPPPICGLNIESALKSANIYDAYFPNLLACAQSYGQNEAGNQEGRPSRRCPSRL